MTLRQYINAASCLFSSYARSASNACHGLPRAPHKRLENTPFRQELLDHAVKLGSIIAARSPVAMQGSKINLNYGRDHTLAQALQYQVATGRGADLDREGISADVGNC